jgi:hypothetical protein
MSARVHEHAAGPHCCAAVVFSSDPSCGLATTLELCLQIPTAAFARSGVRIDASGFQVGVPQGG